MNQEFRNCHLRDPLRLGDGVYFGEVIKDHISNSNRQGRGIEISSDGTVKQGWFVNGKLTGEGRMITSQGNLFEGQFVNGFMQGNGRVLYHSGNEYKGKFMSGVREGFGEMKYADGVSKYVGRWFNDQRNGFGI